MAQDSVSNSFGGKRIDQLCDRFEAAWKTGQRPQMEDYLSEVAESDHPRLLEELLSLELDYRCQAGETPTPDDYRDRFPGHVRLIEAAFREAGAAGRSWNLRPGDVLGDFELVGGRPLGRGGMGQVWKARNRVEDRIVALKVIRPDLLTQDSESGRASIVERFRTEVRAAAGLEHDHIVRLYSVGEDRGRLFYTMQYIDGVSLDRLVVAQQSTVQMTHEAVST